MHVVCVHGLKDSGKTLSTTGLISALCDRGYTVCSTKSMPHNTLDPDDAGKDTRLHLDAGSKAVLAITSNGNLAKPAEQ